MQTNKLSAFLLLLCLPVPFLAQTTGSLTDTRIMEMAAANIETYRRSDAVITLVDPAGKVVDGINVQIEQKSQDFLFGALAFDLVWENRRTDEEVALFKERFASLFNFAIFPFYWGAYEPQPGHPRWERIEPALEWCLSEGITCKGHPLGWTHEIGLPDYVLEMDLEASEILLRSRIMENVTGFRDRITLWDVVNEPVNTVSWSMAHADKSKKRRYTTQVPLEEIVPWVEQAYKTAYAANPGNQYILNEFKQIADPAVRQRFYDFTAELLDRGTPIHGLGLQAHEPRDEWFDPVAIWETLDLYSEFGLPLHITEFSPQSKGAAITGGYRTGTWTPQTQAEFAGMLYRICFGHPSVASINWWGFSDANGWLPGCGIVDDGFNPKPVYETLKKLIKEEWMTPRVNATTDNQGQINFRGFHGFYEVAVESSDGTAKTYRFHLGPEESNAWKITLPQDTFAGIE